MVVPRSAALALVADDAPASSVAPSIGSAASSGSRRSLLVALRDQIAATLDEGVPPRDLAALSRRLLEIARDIEAVDAGEKGDDIGDAAATPDEPWTAG